MSFRTNFYHVSSDNINQMRHMNKAEYDNQGYDFVHDCTDSNSRVLYDAFTNSILEIMNNNEYCHKLFIDPDMEDCDNLYLVMDKNQFLNFIKYVMKKEINYQQSRLIRSGEIDKLEDELKHGFKNDYNAIRGLIYDELPVIHKFIHNQTDINICADWYSLDLTYFDNLINDKWAVSHSWSNQCAIFNLIHIYHMMDWEHDQIVIVGG